MMEPDHYPETDTVEQLVASGMSFFNVANRFYGIQNDSWPFSPKELAEIKALEKMKQENLPTNFLPRIISERHPYAIITTNFDSHSVEEGKVFTQPVHVMKGISPTTLLVWPAKLNWPWIDAVNKLILHLDAGGIRELWFSHFETQLASYYRFLSEDNKSETTFGESSATVLKDVAPHFSVLVVGLLAAVGAFGAEIWWHDRETPAPLPGGRF